jgi:hypothetical protein
MRRNQTGRIGIGGLLMLALIGGAGYMAFKLVPPMVNNFQFDNDVQQETRLSTYNGDSDATIKSKLLGQAQELHLPLTRSQIAVRHDGDRVTVQVAYDVVVEIPDRKITLHFNDHASNVPITQD